MDIQAPNFPSVRRGVLLVCVAGILTLTGCTQKDATQIVLAVATDFAIPAGIDALTIDVTGGATTYNQTFSLSPLDENHLRLPATLAFAASTPPFPELTFSVLGARKGVVAVRRRARLPFVEGRRILLRLVLSLSCGGLKGNCPGEQTCDPDRGCISADIDPATLPDYTEEYAFRGAEAGIADAAVDGPGPASDQGAETILDLSIADAETDVLSTDSTIDLPTPDATFDLPAIDSSLDSVSIDGTIDATVDTIPPPDTVKPTGSEGGPCTGGGGCDPGLVCLSQTCVRLPDATVDMPVDQTIDVPPDTAVDQGPDMTIDMSIDSAPPPADLLVDSLLDTTFDLPPDTVSPDATVDSGPPVFGPAGIALSTSTGGQTFPSGAFDGANFLIVWADSRNTTDQIYGARVTPAGVVLDPQGFLIGSNGTQELREAVVAFDGTNYLVAWRDTNNWDFQIKGVRVSPAGAILDQNHIGISTASGDQQKPAIAFGATNYLVAWQDDRNTVGDEDIYAARVATNGTVIDVNGFAVATVSSTHETDVTIAYGGGAYLLAWQEGVMLRGRRLDPGGTFLDSAPGIEIYAAAATVPQPSAIFDGTNYQVGWNDYPTNLIYVTRISTAGTVIDAGGFAIDSNSATSGAPNIACIGTTCFGSWYDARSGGQDIYGARYGTNGQVIDASGLAVNEASETQTAPITLTDGVDFFVFWQRNAPSGYDLYFNRVSP